MEAHQSHEHSRQDPLHARAAPGLPSMSDLALQGQGAFIPQLSTGIARSRFPGSFRTIQTPESELIVSSFPSHITPSSHWHAHMHTHERSPGRLGGWEDSYDPD